MADPITIGLMIASTALSAMDSIQADNAVEADAKAQQVQYKYQAKQQEQIAGQERAASQRTAIEDRRQATLKSSRAQAIAAAGGGALLDPSVIDIMGDLEAEGEYEAGISLYEGEERALDLEHGAELNKYQGRQARSAGKAAKKASYIKAASTVISGASSMAGGFSGGDTVSTGGGGSITSGVPSPGRKPIRGYNNGY